MKDKRVIAWFGIQLVLTIFLVVNLLGAKESVQLDAASFEGMGQLGEQWYIDESYGENPDFLTSREMSLPTGIYRVRVFYETNTDLVNSCTVTDPYTTHAGVLCNGGYFYAGLDTLEYDVWVWDGNGSLRIEVAYGGSGMLAIKGAEIYNTGALEQILLLAAVMVFGIIDGVWLYKKRNPEFALSPEQKGTFLALTGITMFSSYLLLTDYMLAGADLTFHLHRIEGIKEGLLSGQFPVKIAPHWQQGHGYAASVFYGDTLLYIPALLRILGFPVQTAYKLFLFLINAGTCVISYLCFFKMFQNRSIGVLGSLLYTMSIYRMAEEYYTAGVGEVIALMFLPLLILGFYNIFTEDITDSRYGKNWILPTIGYCGMIQSHILTVYTTAIFTVLLCVLLWKKVLRKATFFVLSKVVIYSTVISAWFLVPFLDYMAEGNFVINHVSRREIQFRGLQPAQLLKVFPFAGDNYNYYENGMADAEPLGLGGALIWGLGLFIAFLWIGKMKDMKKEQVAAGKVALVLGVCAMFMSLQLFPWDKIQRISGLTASLVSSLQFPTRFLGMATAALVVITCVAGVCVWNTENPTWKLGFVAGILALFCMSNLFMINDLGDKDSLMRVYNPECMGTGYISGAEYLPVGTDTSQLVYRAPLGGADVVVEGSEKKGLSVEMTCANLSDGEGYVDMPMLYYRGYQAVTDSGERLEVIAGDNNAVRVLLPGNFEGGVTVDFVRLWYWRVAEAISLIFTMMLLGSGVKRLKEQNHG